MKLKYNFSNQYFISAVCLLFVVGCTPTLITDEAQTPLELGHQLLAQGCQNASVTYKKVPNQHTSNLMDQIKVVRCDGLVSEIYQSVAASDPDGLPVYLELTRPHTFLPDYFNVGAEVSRVVDTMGLPNEQRPDVVKYVNLEGTDSVLLTVSNGRVVSIRWDWYVD